MKMDLSELQSLVSEVISEARKKTEKSAKARHEPKPAAYRYAETFDFSVPLGAYNLYRSQGASNWGPMTGPGTKVDDAFASGRVAPPSDIKESAWDVLSEAADGRINVWEAAQRWYDHQGLGLGKQTSEGIAEKKLGFAKLKNKLSHKKGVSDPAALAASIGRKKLGSAEMARRSAAGRRK